MILAPTIFPKDIFGLPDNAEEIPTKNSGKDVAIAIKTKEAVYSEIPKNRDMKVSEETKIPPERMRA